jgi:hypothetical protein
MRKLILITALLLASASAQAGESQSRSLSLAGAAITEPAKPITQVSMQLAQAATAPTETTAPAQTQAPAATETKTTETKTTDTKPAKPVKKARREGDEAKARRIAAKYGVSW